MISELGTIANELIKRKALMRGGYTKHRLNTFEVRGVERRAKLLIFNAVVGSNATQGCEIWNATKSNITAMESRHFQLLKNLFGFHYEKDGHISMLGLMELAAAEKVMLTPLEAKISQQVLSYAGHMSRRASKLTSEERNDFEITNLITAKLVLPKDYQAPLVLNERAMEKPTEMSSAVPWTILGLIVSLGKIQRAFRRKPLGRNT